MLDFENSRLVGCYVICSYKFGLLSRHGHSSQQLLADLAVRSVDASSPFT